MIGLAAERAAIGAPEPDEVFRVVANVTAILRGCPPFEGYDPDSYLRAHGLETFCRLVDVPIPPFVHPKRRRYDRVWDAIELDYARREYTALWREEGLADVVKAQREHAEDARRAEVARSIRERLAAGGCGDIVSRASAYLATIDGGPKGLVRAAFLLSQGWALDAEQVTAMLRAEYVPRYHRKVPDGELTGIVRRAQRAPCNDRGWLVKGRDR